MFAAPPAIEAQLFAAIPGQFARRGRRSDWVDGQLAGVETPTFLEGPSFDRDGNLWVTDIPWGRLFRITPAGQVSVAAEYVGEPNGLKFHRDGRAFIADHKNGIMVFDPSTGRVDPFLDRPELERFKGVNDLVFARNGDLYFTDQGQSSLKDPSGRLYRLRVDGRLECLLDHVPSPNGLVLNKAENTLFLAVTRANQIWRVALRPDGRIGKVGTFIQMSGGNGPDGLAIDEEDNLVVCHFGLGAVWLFSALGEPMLRIRSSFGPWTTNCAFGGPDNSTLYITESKSGSILTAPLPVRGRLMYSHL
jgi:gluconolactonase